jgi:glycosyltransferase involved in cell wall biosynthesis
LILSPVTGIQDFELTTDNPQKQNPAIANSDLLNLAGELSGSRQLLCDDVRQDGITVVHVVEGCKGGVGTVVASMINSQVQDPGISQVHLVADADKLGDMLLTAPAIWHYYKSSRDPFQITRVISELDKCLVDISPTIVFLHSTFPGLYGRFHKKTSHKWACIYCAHGWAFCQQLPAIQRKLYGAVERYLAPRADAIVSISFSEFDEAVATGVKNPIHRVIYHGLRARKVAHDPPIRVSGEAISLGFIGRFDRQKGLDLMLKVMEDPRIASFSLWIIGAATLDVPLTIPNQPNIHSVGWVSNVDIDSYINCFDAIVMPSRWEGFGLTALEAMRNGKPVIASRVGGLSELLIDGVNGIFIDPEDTEGFVAKLTSLSKDSLRSMGEAAFTIFSTGFGLDRANLQWSGLMQQVLEERGSGTAYRAIGEESHNVFSELSGEPARAPLLIADADDR